MMRSRQIPDEVFEVFGLVSLAAPDRTSLAHRLSKLMSSAQTLDLLRFQISEDLFQRFEVESEFSACESGHHATSQAQGGCGAVASMDRPSSPVPDVPFN
jgi:hypothetical protein